MTASATPCVVRVEALHVHSQFLVVFHLSPAFDSPVGAYCDQVLLENLVLVVLKELRESSSRIAMAVLINQRNSGAL